jgi:hypothetical protein
MLYFATEAGAGCYTITSWAAWYPPLLRHDPAADTWTELAAPNVAAIRRRGGAG